MEMRGVSSNRVEEEQNNVVPRSTNSNNMDAITNPPQQQPSPQPQLIIRYGECQKNHAANAGGHVTDGCGEFMPSGEEGLKCAACDCHRSFHRREVEGGAEPPVGPATIQYYPYNQHISNSNLAHRSTIGHLAPHLAPPPLPTVAPQHRYNCTAVPPVMMAFGGGVATESSSEEIDLMQMNNHGGGQSTSKRRFRTKFTPEQKGRMREFAERIGWKIQKQNEVEVQQFCTAVGIKRQVFKVWMHNCNQASKKKQS